MMRDAPFEAVICDLDGVLTRTAVLHERAWRRLFDELLRDRADQAPFSSADYRAYIDGKPRHDAARDFLAARGLALPPGSPDDGPEQDTIYGLASRKNGYFLELLAREGVFVFDDAVAALARWRRGGLRLAVVSASQNCRRVLHAAGLDHDFDVVVDGQAAHALGLPGKLELVREAARTLGVAPADAVVLEDATAGVRAARDGGFGLVVGVAHAGNDEDLREAGAQLVERDVFRVRFPRRLPDVMQRLDELAAWRGSRPLAVFLDYDGTLTPIVGRPEDAWLGDDTRAALRALAARWPVAVVSGRDRADLERRVGLDGLYYAGNHGFDIAGHGRARTHAEADQALGALDRAERELRQHVGRLSGVLVERKRYSIAVHYRLVASDAVVAEVARVVEGLRASSGLRRRAGKKVLELEPAVDWNKGRALRWLVDVLPPGAERPFVIYAGDDETDEDAFAALAGDGAGVRVGETIASSLADYRATDPAEVRALLVHLTGVR